MNYSFIQEKGKTLEKFLHNKGVKNSLMWNTVSRATNAQTNKHVALNGMLVLCGNNNLLNAYIIQNSRK